MKKTILTVIIASAWWLTSAHAADSVTDALAAITVACSPAHRIFDKSPIADRIPFDGRTPSLKQMADDGYPNAAQRKFLLGIDDLLKDCHEGGMKATQKIFPIGSTDIVSQTWEEQLKLVAQLVRHRLTFGDFNTRRADLEQKQIVAIRALQTQQKQQAAIAQEQENEQFANDQARTQALAQQEEQLRLQRFSAVAGVLNRPIYQIPMPRAPVTTNCYGYGSSLSCTTR